MEDSTSNMSIKSEDSSDVSTSDNTTNNKPQNYSFYSNNRKRVWNFYKYKTEEDLKKYEEEKQKRKLKAEKEAEKRALKKQMELEERQQRKEHAVKGMNYLLGKSQLYSQFLGDKLAKHLNDNESPVDKGEILTNNENTKLSGKNNDDTDKVSVNNDTDNEIPKYFTGGTLRPYQMEGLTWLKLLFENGINGILADEMGLGKTIQVIALVSYLYEKNVPGPFLIIAPLSVTTNWLTEFEKFAPKLPVIFFYGETRTKKGRSIEQLRQEATHDYWLDGKFVKPIIVTTYQVVVAEKKFLGKFKWCYIILDEAQYIKNSDSRRYIVIDNFRSLNRLLLTGTPLQNNLTELWALLHFLMPNIFGSNSDTTFTSVLNLDDFKSVDATVENDEIKDIISTIHGVLNPFLLRRLKQDVLEDVVPKKELIVYCPLSDMQRTLTKYVLERNLESLAGRQVEIMSGSRSKRKCSLNVPSYNETVIDFRKNDDFINYLQKYNDISEENRTLLAKLSTDTNNERSEDGVRIVRSVNLAVPFMALREIANHPYLLHMPTILNEQGKPQLKVDENLIHASGKLRMLDLLLTRLKAENHKVLIYSCFVMMLDIVEEYLIYRNYKYARLDGSYRLEARKTEINKFCEEEETFAFIITTRAGGIGLNLVEADTVIFMDLDHNPQADIQAQDRCHRIGQTKPVVIYKLVSHGTIDEKILRSGEMKRRLEKVIIKNSRLKESNYKSVKNLNKEELLQLLKSVESTREIYSSSDSTRPVLSKHELDQLMDRSDLDQQLIETLAKIKPQKQNETILPTS